MRPRLTVATIVALALVAPAVASGDTWQPAPRTPLQIAAAFWHAEPTDCKSITVRATWLAGEVGTIVQRPRCEILLSRALVNRGTFSSRIRTCSTVVHEYGHLLGHGHSENSDSIMFPEENLTVRACYERFIGNNARLDRKLNGDRSWATR